MQYPKKAMHLAHSVELLMPEHDSAQGHAVTHVSEADKESFKSYESSELSNSDMQAIMDTCDPTDTEVWRQATTKPTLIAKLALATTAQSGKVRSAIDGGKPASFASAAPLLAQAALEFDAGWNEAYPLLSELQGQEGPGGLRTEPLLVTAQQSRRVLRCAPSDAASPVSLQLRWHERALDRGWAHGLKTVGPHPR